MKRFDQVVVVTLNPTIDRVLEVSDFRAGGHQRCVRRDRYPAGKGINVVRAMASLGQTATLTGFVGEAESEWYQQFLLGEGIEDCRLISVPGFTRENITVVDPNAPGSDTHLMEQGFTVMADELAQLRDSLGPLASAGNLVSFCGSLPPGVSAEQFAELIRLCLDSGAEVAVDTSGDSLRASARLPLWLVKPNRQELTELSGHTSQTDELLLSSASLLAEQIRWVLLSLGGEGAVLVDSRIARRAVLPLRTEEVVSTVGCGDILFGGFLAGWQGAEWKEGDLQEVPDPASEALRRGVAAATFAATQLTPTIALARVQALEPDVEISNTDLPDASRPNE